MKKFCYLLSAMMICGGCLFGCTSDKEQVKEHQAVQEEVVISETEEKQDVKEETKEVTEEEVNNYEFNVGDTFYYYQDDEIVGEIKITNVSWTDYRNEFADEDYDKDIVNVLQIDWEYTNIDVKDWDGNSTEWMFSDWDFDVYDNSNRKLETYPTDNYGDGLVSKGRTGEGSQNYVVFDDCTHFELEIGNVLIKVDLQ